MEPGEHVVALSLCFIPFEGFGVCHFHCFVADKRVLMKEWKHDPGTDFMLLCSWDPPLNSEKSQYPHVNVGG